ncbi:2-C-methyl-D-erythritol 4-phosphate cytidylyltransferase [Mucilaginibacter sp. BJC16-A38]|uniref:2-C-methyl-D-erythritol 4-phosphate cytidylyltransferase n=1 Tax=Mucilaginibacter phenanthrenivorans TaxID=1234842 RepID=UPI0021583B04|nr:2-C-methyl-D-erythritol 4-phosphate cytidylyltransferase [Mucilaginibacter phenanthrenivorans]MCR8559869.1 2-C-methyl-D-erythritol 4-phosphate cytidylyltransferase [Mucilaginibacter phenanthrenivorans]
MTFKSYAIIVAGGSGTRMQAAVPKQFLLLGDKPVIMHTIEAFYGSALKPVIILVLPAEYHDYWQQLCVEYNFTIPHSLVTGGETRFHSVKNGLDLISNDEDALIAVHDAVRPLISANIIEKSYKHAAEHGNAVVAVKSRDSVRLVENENSKSLIRDHVYLVQTPQTFQSAQIKKAYLQPYKAKFTDDASVIEEIGLKINLVEGSHQNIKITFPEDLAIAEVILKKVHS